MITIENIIVNGITQNSFNIEWDSKQGGTSEIEFSDGHITNQELFSYFHITKVENLQPGTSYTFRIKSVDRYNGITYSNSITVVTLTQLQWETDVISARGDGQLPQTYYLSTTGNDSANGKTIATAWKTLSVVINRLLPGDTLLVMPGIWNGANVALLNQSGVDYAPIKIKAYDPINRPIFQGITTPGNGIQINEIIKTSGSSYWEIDGLVCNNYGRVYSFLNGSHHIKLLNCDGDSNSTTVFIYHNNHHIITKNIMITKGKWNDWFCQNGEFTIPGQGNHHIIADNVTSRQQGFYKGTSIHNGFDLHSELDPTGTNNNYINLWNCSVLDIGVKSFGVCPLFIHEYTGVSSFVSVINFTVRDMWRAWIGMNPGNNLYIDGVQADQCYGMYIFGWGKNITIKNVRNNMRPWEPATSNYQSAGAGVYIWCKDIDGMLFENVNITGVDPSMPIFQNSAGAPARNVTIINCPGFPGSGPICPKPQFNFDITQNI